MCAFCLAIPMAASIGVASAGKQSEKRLDSVARGEQPPPTRLPAGRLTVVIVVTLLIASAIYHTVLLPRIGI